LLNDYVRIPYANGSSFARQFLFREFSARGHQVTVVGPDDRLHGPTTLPPRHVMLAAGPLRNHPGVRIPLPTPQGLRDVARRNASTWWLGQGRLRAGSISAFWLRAARGVPFLAVKHPSICPPKPVSNQTQKKQPFFSFLQRADIGETSKKKRRGVWGKKKKKKKKKKRIVPRAACWGGEPRKKLEVAGESGAVLFF